MGLVIMRWATYGELGVVVQEQCWTDKDDGLPMTYQPSHHALISIHQSATRHMQRVSEQTTQAGRDPASCPDGDSRILLGQKAAADGASSASLLTAQSWRSSWQKLLIGTLFTSGAT